jgi:protease-4
MKGFFKMMFASIVGIFVSMLLIFFILLGIVGGLMSSADKPVVVEPNSILKLTLDKEIVERSASSIFSDIDIPGFNRTKQEGLTEILENINKAKTDSNIKGIYLELSIIPAGIASIEAIRNALIDFKTSGKFVVSYADFYAQGAYYLATASDKIYLNPEGSVDFHGLRSEVMFFKGALEKLGIEAQIIRHGKFKSAVEPFMNDKMSPENREQINKLLTTVWNHTISEIEKSRKVSADELNRLANNLTLVDADSCIAHKMVDSLYYLDQLNALLVKLSGKTGKKPEFISSAKYEKVAKAPSGKPFAKAKIAVVYAYGDVMGDGGEGDVASQRISKALADARTDTAVKAIVFRINSPGGSALASDIIWREVKLASKEKPVVASMGDLAASGGYYIACAADTIVAQPNTITGSIGVFGVMMNAKQLLNQKLGITTDVVKTNTHSDFPTISRPMDAQEKAFVQFEIEKIYKTFIGHVAEGRNMTTEKVDEIGQGRVWSGIDAKELGLVDVIGGLNDAIELAAKMAKIDNYRVSNLPKLEEPFEKFMKDISGDVKASIVKSELGDQYKYIEQYKKLLQLNGIQARLPFGIEIY